MRNLRVKVLLAIVVVALLFLVAESVLRLMGYMPAYAVPDHVLGYRYRPNAEYRWGTESYTGNRFNAAGWRDDDHQLPKPAGVTRILVVGDGLVDALHVPLDSTFHRLLDKNLTLHAPRGRQFEVIAMGQAGNGTTEEYLTYRHWGVDYDPNVVVVLFNVDDVWDNWPADPANANRPFFVPKGESLVVVDTTFSSSASFREHGGLARLAVHSSLLTLVSQALRQGTTTTASVPPALYARWVFDRRARVDSLPVFRLTEHALARFAREVRRDGRRFVVFAPGVAEQEDPAEIARNRANPHFDPDKTMRWLKAAGARSGFEVVPLTPAFRQARAAGRGPFWTGTPGRYGQWNASGHAVTAAVMERWCMENLVRQRRP